MNDLISRQAVLEATSTTLKITGKENAETVYAYIKKLCDDIKALPSAQQWIPCSEEEPPFGIEVLITRKGTVRLAERSIFDKEYPWYIHGHHSYNVKTVDAWMPLPEPYREGTES